MKKVFMGMFALATMLLATSCSEDEIVAQSSGDEVTVSFTTELRGDIKTKAVGDGTTVDKLVFAVYEDGEEITELRQNNVTVADKQATVNVVLLKGHTYQFAFWAQASNCSAYNTTDLRNVVVSYNSATNNHEFRDAFFANHELTVNAAQEVTITLKRPFAQLNVGTTKEEWKAALKAANISDESFNGKSSVSFSSSNVADQINLLTGEVSQSESLPETITFAQKEMVSEGLVAGGEEYKYLSMSYLLVKDADGKGVKLSKLEDLKAVFDINGKTITFAPSADKEIPIQRNWRTNIIGNILTSGVDFNVIIDEVFSGENNVTDDGNESLGVKVGETYYETINEALEANENESNITVELAEGEFEWPADSYIQNKTLTIMGSNKENTVIKLSKSSYASGSIIKLENLTYDVPTGLVYDEHNFAYIHHAEEFNMTDCNSNGRLRLDVEKATIDQCLFTVTTSNGFDGYAIFYYGKDGSEVTVNNSTFTTAGKAIVIYNEGAKDFNLNVNTCTFTSSNEETDKAAIQMHTEYGIYGTLTVNNSTATGFADINDGLWNELNNNSGAITNNFVKTIDGKQPIADGVSLNTTTGEYEISSAAGLSYFSGKKLEGTIKITAETIDMNNQEIKTIAAAYDKELTINGNGCVIKNVTLADGGHNSVNCVSLFQTYTGSTLKIVDLAVDGVKVSSDAGATYAAAIIGYNEGTTELDNVDVTNANITGVKSSGVLFGHITSSGNGVVIKGCDVTTSSVTATGTSSSTGEAYPKGAYVGRVQNNVTITGCTNTTELTNVGEVLSGTVTIDGTEME